MTQNQQQIENLGPAEKVIQALINPTDHLHHGRPGIVIPDRRKNIGVRWAPVTHKVEEDQKVCYRLDKVGKKTNKVRLGIIGDDNKVRDGGRIVGEYRKPGIFPEVAAWMYTQVADVWKLDQEFVARWASWALDQDYRDMKVILAAFLLAQAERVGEVIRDGEDTFRDEDFRAVGEAMILLRRKGKKDMDPKMVARVGDVLRLPEIAGINRSLGFGRSAKHPHLGRYPKAITHWIRFRERNPKVLAGLVRAGMKRRVVSLAASVRYKAESPTFYQTLGWKQKQAKDGRRNIAIGEVESLAVDWSSLSEAEVCQKIVEERPSFKVIVSRIGHLGGWTRAVMAASIEAGAVSNKDLIILSETLEDLGLLDVPAIKARWQAALKAADDMRAANIAARMKRAELAQEMENAADEVAQVKVEEAMRGLVFGWLIDRSSSQQDAIEGSKNFLKKLVPCFPKEALTMATFNNNGFPLRIRTWTRAGVAQAFRGIKAGGGTSHGAGFQSLIRQGLRVPDDQDFVLWVFGDQADQHTGLVNAIQRSGISPVAIVWHQTRSFGDFVEDGAVTRTARALGIPVVRTDALEEALKTEDPYTFLRTLRHLIAATPAAAGRVAAAPRRARVTLVEQILKTDIVQKPAWAA